MMVESKSMDIGASKKMSRKRKKSTIAPLASKSSKLDPSDDAVESKQKIGFQKTEGPQIKIESPSLEEIGARFPILKNEELVQKFLSVSLTNNQKGRIRQLFRDNLKGTEDHLLADVIHNRIQAILKGSQNLNDTDLRKVRILYNMLKTALTNEKKSFENKAIVKKKTINKEKKAKKVKEAKCEDVNNVTVTKLEAKTEKKEQMVQKEKGKKRYVVFLGNLPLEVNKEMIMKHFFEMNEHIVDIRIPKIKEERKSAIAYVELKNEPTYELALSKHHSMLCNKRINVLYTAQKNGKVTKAQAKSKSAKLVALQKSGTLIGSTPLNKKRSQRRMKMKKAQAQREKELGL